MADESTYGGGMPGIMAGGNTDFGSELPIGGGDAAPGPGADVPPAPVQTAQAAPQERPAFGSSFHLGIGPNYTAPDPQLSPLDQSADTLQQRIKRANEVATNPLLQIFNPDGAKAARDFVPAASEMLQKIRTQQAGIIAGRQQAATLGLDPGEVRDEATQADRVEVAKARALKGDLKVFKGLQAVDPKAAEAIQDQVQETVAGHLTKAQYAFDKLSNMTNEGEYNAAVSSLRKDGSLTDLEALGLKVPRSFQEFSANRAKEGQALREARIGIDTVRQKLEERNTYQPMEKKEAETYAGRMTTVYGDQISNGTWGRNASSNARGLIVNGAADPRDLGKKFTFATPDQRKAIEEESDKNVPKEEREKFRAFQRTYDLATHDAKGSKVPDGTINTNPNVQQGIAEGLASMLRGGSGGANIGLLKIETSKRGFLQGLVDKIETEHGAVINELKGKDVNPYLSKLTQAQIRDVMDAINQFNNISVGRRVAPIAERAGALGLDPSSLGYSKDEVPQSVAEAFERGRQAQIERMTPGHQAIGGGDGVFQLGAQRPGAGATSLPPGTAPTTQQPGAQPLATPVQQGQGSPPPGPQGPPGGSPPPAASPQAGAQPPTGPQPGGGGTPPAPVQPQRFNVAGQDIDVPLPPGASPAFVRATQRIESGNEKDPWKAGGSRGVSASGAFQFINSTWAENKPAGAPDRAKDATPQQQAEAFANLTQKNANALDKAGVPVNDTNLYVAHNLGAAGGAKLLQADPKADARTVVGDRAANNNPMFFRGKPTVAEALARYQKEMEKGSQAPDDAGPKPRPGSGGAMADVLSRAGSALARAGVEMIPGIGPAAAAYNMLPESAQRTIKDTATEHAPAIGSTAGAVAGGGAAGPVGAVAGGAAGGAAGQVLKDYLQGNEQDPQKIAKEAALGGVLGIAPEGRPLVGAAARVLGAGAVEGADTAAKGGDAVDVADAAAKTGALAAGGELFGRALGMVGHKVWNLFNGDAKAAVRDAAKTYSEAQQVLETESPKLPGANGAAGGANPKYEAAEKAATQAEKTLKDAGLNPEEAAYAHKVSSEGVPKEEAQVSKPAALEQERLGAGYQKIEQAVGERGVGAPKAAPKLTDGPIAAVENKQVPKAFGELAEKVEMAITAPAKSWQEKWVQLKEARSDLLKAEREAQNSTSDRKGETAAAYRTLADTVRKQQEKAAKYVFGEKDGEKVMGWLKMIDVRYRRLMEATNGGDLTKAAAMKGEAGREADRRFRAFAADDPAALAAWDAMRKQGSNVERDVRTLVAVERIPGLGHAISAAKLLAGLNEWRRERAAGSPVKFEDVVKLFGDDGGKIAKDIGGAAGSRAATM